MSVKPLVIIPARVGSKGVPNKNFATLPDGTTLLSRAIDVGLQIGEVVVTTDAFSEIPMKYLGAIKVEPRKPELAQDDTPMSAVVEDVLATIPGPPDQPIVLLQPTVPFRTVAQVQACLTSFRLTSKPTCTVRAIPDAYWKAQPSGDFVVTAERRQDTDPLYLASGTAYVCRRDAAWPWVWKTLAESGDPYLDINEEADWQALLTHLELAKLSQT